MASTNINKSVSWHFIISSCRTMCKKSATRPSKKLHTISVELEFWTFMSRVTLIFFFTKKDQNDSEKSRKTSFLPLFFISRCLTFKPACCEFYFSIFGSLIQGLTPLKIKGFFGGGPNLALSSQTLLPNRCARLLKQAGVLRPNCSGSGQLVNYKCSLMVLQVPKDGFR